VIVGIILLSAVVTGYESMGVCAPQRIEYLGAVMVASVIGFFWVMRQLQRFRLKVGQEIGSAALVADGHHARVDG